MLRLIFPILFSCAVMIMLPFQVQAQDGSNELAFSGVLLDQGNNPTLDHFTQWLSKKASYQLTPSYQESYQGISDVLKQNTRSVAWTCGAPFVQDYQKDGQQLIAVPLFQGKPSYHSLVITRAGRSERSLFDFKGLLFAYSDARSNSGFVVPAFELKKQGADMKHFFRVMVHTGSHEGSIDAVLHGLVDVANVDEYILVEYLKSHPEAKAKIVVLERFGPFPFTPIVAGNSISKAAVKRFQIALVNMHHDVEGKEILVQLGLDGFVVKPVSFYKPIADMLLVLKRNNAAL
ncbi:MAG: PhnD/SsuA/transferrin family substrate-binding protein [Mariprofundaceae bacterium]